MYVSPIANDILAGHLLNYGAVSFMTETPMRLKSGLVTPIYVDNRSLTGHPDAWRDIIETMCSRISQLGLKFDIIAGVEGAGVSHSAALAYRLGKPSVFVRQRAKTYGDHSRVEGTPVKGKRVLIIEDHVSTGLSLLSAVEGLKAEGAIVEDCVAITSFGIDETTKLFQKENFTCHELLDFSLVLDKAVATGLIDEPKKALLLDWLANPWTWAARNGLTPSGNEN